MPLYEAEGGEGEKTKLILRNQESIFFSLVLL